MEAAKLENEVLAVVPRQASNAQPSLFVVSLMWVAQHPHKAL